MKILCFGPIIPPNQGQAVAFTAFCRSLNPADSIIIDINFGDKNPISKVFLSVFVVLKIATTFLFKKPDLVYFTCSRSIFGSLRDVVLLAFSRIFTVKVITHLHGADFKTFYDNAPSFYRKIIHYFYKDIHAAIVLSDKMSDQFAMFENLKIHTVANFFEDDIGHLQNFKIPPQNPAKVRLLFLSNLMKTKGILLLLEAFSELQKSYPEVKLDIAGYFIGDYEMSKSTLKNEFFKLLKTSPNVEYLGAVSGQKKADLLKSSTILVLPSFHVSEAVPLVIIEAFASGLAVLTTKHNFLPDLVDDKSGVLVEPNSKNALLDGLVKMLENPKKIEKMRQNNLKLAHQKYSKSAYLANLHKIIQ